MAWSNSSMSLASSRRVARKTRATEDAGNWRCRIHICLWRHLEGLHAKLVPRKMRATSDDSKADGQWPYSRPTPSRAWSATTASTDVHTVDDRRGSMHGSEHRKKKEFLGKIHKRQKTKGWIVPPGMRIYYHLLTRR